MKGRDGKGERQMMKRGGQRREERERARVRGGEKGFGEREDEGFWRKRKARGSRNSL